MRSHGGDAGVVQPDLLEDGLDELLAVLVRGSGVGPEGAEFLQELSATGGNVVPVLGWRRGEVAQLAIDRGLAALVLRPTHVAIGVDVVEAGLGALETLNLPRLIGRVSGRGVEQLLVARAPILGESEAPCRRGVNERKCPAYPRNELLS
jgi:hypothetical protein